MNYFILLQINDALFPIGAYTQSYGLETYVQKNIIHNASTFKKYLVNTLNYNLLYNDLLSVKLAYLAASEKNMATLSALNQIVSATKIAREVREASQKLGSRFIKNIFALNLSFDHAVFSQSASHYAVAYGALCGALELDPTLSLQHFLYAQISSIVNTAVKLIPLSQTAGQILLTDIQSDLTAALEKLETLTIDDLGRSSPGFELRCMQHERLYSRLYMS